MITITLDGIEKTVCDKSIFVISRPKPDGLTALDVLAAIG